MCFSILIIEDEKRSAQWLKTYVEREGFKAEIAYNGQTGLKSARTSKPDLILLDLRLPVISGNELCRILRKESDVPIIMLTAKGSAEDRISGLRDGADDYIVKPYEPEEVIGRIRAVLRRSTKSGACSSALPACGPLRADPASETVRLNDEVIHMTHAQFSVLLVFMKNPGTVLTRAQIIEQAFSNNFDAYDRAVDTHIRRLRKLINRDDFNPIKTVYGGGYKLECE